MYPQICKIGPFTIYSYGLMLTLGFLISLLLASRQAKKQDIDADIVFNFSFGLIIFGIIGGRIFYIIQNINYYLKNPGEILMFQHGGLAWFGGLFFGFIFSILYLKKKNLRVYRIFDLISPFLALGQAIGRVGCLLNGCCFGKATDRLGLYFKVHDAVLIPTQIYSSLLLILIFIILRFFQDRPHKEGQIFFSYLLLYSLKRFLLEFWRADNAIILFGLTLFQLLSIIIFFLALIKLILIQKTKN